MTDDEMTAAIYRRLWPEKGDLMRNDGVWLYQSGHGWAELPDWPHSLDLCYRDLVPFMRQRDPHADLTLTGDGSGGWWAHWIWHDDGELRYDPALAGEPALAVCMATLAALGIDAEAEAVQA